MKENGLTIYIGGRNGSAIGQAAPLELPSSATPLSEGGSSPEAAVTGVATGASVSASAGGNHADPSIARSYWVQAAPSGRPFSSRSKLPSLPPRLSIAWTSVASRVQGVTGLPFSYVP